VLSLFGLGLGFGIMLWGGTTGLAGGIGIGGVGGGTTGVGFGTTGTGLFGSSG